MLWRKLMRTAWKYKAQFISMIIMIAIGMGIFMGFNAEWYSMEIDSNSFFEQTCYADYRLYHDQGFSEEDIDAVKKIGGGEPLLFGQCRIERRRSIACPYSCRRLYRFDDAHYVGKKV